MMNEYEKIDLAFNEKTEEARRLREEIAEFRRLLELEKRNSEAIQLLVHHQERVILSQKQQISSVTREYEELQRGVELKIYQSTRSLKNELEELQNQRHIFLDTSPGSESPQNHYFSLSSFLILKRNSFHSIDIKNT